MTPALAFCVLVRAHHDHHPYTLAEFEAALDALPAHCRVYAQGDLDLIATLDSTWRYLQRQQP